MSKRAGPIPADHGFTTLEVLLVVAIIGILAVVALPRIDLYRIQANSAVQIMSTSMVAAQREALTKQHDMILTFDVPNRRIRLIWDANSNSVVDGNERTRSVQPMRPWGPTLRSASATSELSPLTACAVTSSSRPAPARAR